MVYLSKDRLHYVSKPLIYLENLMNDGFVRVHKSYLINIEYLEAYKNKDGGYAELQGGFTVPVSRRKKKSLIQKIQSET